MKERIIDSIIREVIEKKINVQDTVKLAFEELKESIIESIKFTKSLTDLKETLETILREYDSEDEECNTM